MKCDYCDLEMEKRQATVAEPYRYLLSGLDDVYLAEVAVYRCPKCRFEAPIIPKAEELHRVIALGLIKRPRRLSGSEVRFLRKHAGLPARQFARLLGVTPEHLSRVENGHTQAFGQPTDRLIRTVTLTAVDGPKARELLLEIADEIGKRAASGRRQQTSLVYRLEKTTWRRAA